MNASAPALANDDLPSDEEEAFLDDLPADGPEFAPFRNPDGGARIKLRTFGRSVNELLAFARLLLSSMEDNPNFPDPQPPQESFADLLAAAERSHKEAGLLKLEYKAAIMRRNEWLQHLVAAIDERGSYVQMRSQGNAVAIRSAGIDLRKPRRPIPILPPPTGLVVELNGLPGVMILTWNKVKQARGYMLEYGPVDGPMRQQVLLGRRKLRLNEMKAGVMYQFRLATIGGASGQSMWGSWVKRCAA